MWVSSSFVVVYKMQCSTVIGICIINASDLLSTSAFIVVINYIPLMIRCLKFVVVSRLFTHVQHA